MALKKRMGIALIVFSCAVAQDIADYGLILGGDYALFSGRDARNMAVYVQGMEFDDGLLPFRPGVNAQSEPAGVFGPVLGAYMRVTLGELFFARLDAAYLWKGGEYTITLDTVDTYGGRDSLNMIYANNRNNPVADPVLPGFRRIVIRNAYLEMPLLLGINATREFSIFAGPHLSVALHNTFELHITEGRFYAENGSPLSFGKRSYTDLKQKIERVDWGLTFGANYIFTDQFQLGLRWASGNRPFLDRDNPPAITQNTLQLVASMNFSEF